MNTRSKTRASAGEPSTPLGSNGSVPSNRKRRYSSIDESARDSHTEASSLSSGKTHPKKRLLVALSVHPDKLSNIIITNCMPDSVSTSSETKATSARAVPIKRSKKLAKSEVGTALSQRSAGTTWSRKESYQLIKFQGKAFGFKHARIAQELGRSQLACRLHLHYLKRGKFAWTQQDLLDELDMEYASRLEATAPGTRSHDTSATMLLTAVDGGETRELHEPKCPAVNIPSDNNSGMVGFDALLLAASLRETSPSKCMPPPTPSDAPNLPFRPLSDSVTMAVSISALPQNLPTPPRTPLLRPMHLGRSLTASSLPPPPMYVTCAISVSTASTPTSAQDVSDRMALYKILN